MRRSYLTGRFISIKWLVVFFICFACSSFINKLNPFPAPLKFHVMVMNAADASRLADPANSFDHFVLQNQNPDNNSPGGGNPRHNFTLITFAYFLGNHNPDTSTVYLRPPPTTWPNNMKTADIRGHVKLANLKLNREKLASTIPPTNSGFAFLVFMPFEGGNEMNPNHATEQNYVCYEIYPARADGSRIGEHIMINGKKRFAFSAVVHPSPPAGFD